MNNIQKIILLYLVIINFIAFIMMGIDKHKAIHHKWRIPERNLFLSAILLGSPGAILGMKVFHHKTLHKSFVIGMPAILIVQIILTAIYYFVIK